MNLHESFYNVCTVIKGFKARVVLQVNRLYAMYMCCYNLIHVGNPSVSEVLCHSRIGNKFISAI